MLPGMFLSRSILLICRKERDVLCDKQKEIFIYLFFFLFSFFQVPECSGHSVKAELPSLLDAGRYLMKAELSVDGVIKRPITLAGESFYRIALWSEPQFSLTFSQTLPVSEKMKRQPSYFLRLKGRTTGLTYRFSLLLPRDIRAGGEYRVSYRVKEYLPADFYDVSLVAGKRSVPFPPLQVVERKVKNEARHRPYKLLTLPDYQVKGSLFYPNKAWDERILTDSLYYPYQERFGFLPKAYVGWSNVTSGVSVLLYADRCKTVEGVALHVAGGGGWGIEFPEKVSVSGVSSEGLKAEIASLQVKISPHEKGRDFFHRFLKVPVIKGQYTTLTLTVFSKTYLFIDEVALLCSVSF